MRAIELLAPARNLECGVEAILHGADAVYIGASRFGARAAAGNSLEDIARLVDFARPFGVRIYVTLNTLFRPDERPAVQALIDDLAAIGVSALITQDPYICPASAPLPLHSSTQMDNRTVADIRARQAAGFRQTVLARELSLTDIRAIHAAVPEMPLEVFVHGALCVSYSGRCYASEYCFQRSANRGECAQFCRLPFDLVDSDGHVVEHQKHLLSLRDMSRAADLESLLDAGVSSFKIEGRLKDVAYVKNITAYYRRHLDGILRRRSDTYCRSSFGLSEISFIPNPQKSFNRGFTDYFLHGRTADLACHATPKALGEPVGTVKDTARGYLSVAGTSTFSNGDGLCFFAPDGRLVGFRVNRVDQHGRLFPADTSFLPLLSSGVQLYRNFDAAFEHLLSRPTAVRRLAVRWLLEDIPVSTSACRTSGSSSVPAFRLTITAESGASASLTFPHPHEEARTPQSDNIRRQLLRLGDTPFSCTPEDIDLRLSAEFFIPSSTLADWRRQLTAALLSAPVPVGPSSDKTVKPRTPVRTSPSLTAEDSSRVQVSAGSPSSFPATATPQSTPLMTCRYCVRHALGQCLRQQPTLRGPLSLQLADGRRFPLHFDCQRCEMQVLAPAKTVFTPEF